MKIAPFLERALLATLANMTNPDWNRRLLRYDQESAKSRGLTLQSYLDRRHGR